MAAVSTQNANTTRPLSPEDATAMQARGHPSNSIFIQIYRAQNRVEFPTNFLALLNRFRCKLCALLKALEVTGAACACNHTDRPRHLRQFLPQAKLSYVIPRRFNYWCRDSCLT